MVILKFTIFLFSIFLLGYPLVSLLIKDQRPFLARLAISWGIGAALIPLELFLGFFILKFKFNLAIFYLILIVQIALLFYLVFKNNNSGSRFNLTALKFAWPKLKLSSAAILILIFIQIVFLFLNVLARPTLAYDNLAMWQYKPKILFYENQINFDKQKYAYLGGGGHINYPWQTQLLSYWLYANLGEFNDQLSNFINLIYYLFILFVIYYFIRQYLSAFISLIFVWFFSTLPLPFYHAYNGYADLILSYYLLLVFIFLFYWLQKERQDKLLLAGVFFSSALFVKNDAIFIIAGLLTIMLKLFLSKRKFISQLKTAGIYLLVIILPLLPWLFIKIKYNLTFKNVEPGISYHGEVWRNIYESLFLSNSFNIWWFIVILSLALNFMKIKKQNNLLLAWLFLILCLTGLITLYLFTEEYRFAIDNTALSRNFLTLIPVSVILAAVSFAPQTERPAGWQLSLALL